MKTIDANLLVLVGILTAVFTTLLIVMLSYLRNTKDQRYNTELHRAELEKLRASFEQQIRDLTFRLLSTESRWKDVHQLQVSAQQAIDKEQPSNEVHLSDFFENLGVSGKSVKVDKNLVFVLTPFDDEEYKTFETIRKVCTRVGLKCLRGDEEYVERGDILSHILQYLVSARIVIANINGRNPNVLYELGIAHAISKPTILVGKSLAEVPFDVKSKRIILYNTFDELERNLTEELTRVLISV